MIRTLSYTEIRRALSCPAQWDFAYSDRLAGSSLHSKALAPILSEGRAFGAAAAAWHVSLEGEPVIEAMDLSLEADADEQREFGLYLKSEHNAMRERMLAILTHYTSSIEAFTIDPVVEHELLVPIPSRTGRRASSRYRFQGFVDGIEWDEAMNRPWLVEFKLRRQLTPVAQIQLDRQIRWYAWAYWQATGVKVAGVKVVERLNQPPKPPRILKSKKPSHAKDQLCTEEAYRAVCGEHDEPVNEEAAEALGRRQWEQVVPIMFRQGELDEAGHELVAAGQIIGSLDHGDVLPLRNPSRANCGGCSFREICPAPDPGLIDQLFERRPPKRDRPRLEEEEAAVEAAEGVAA